MLEYLVDRIRTVDDRDDGNDEFKELGSISIREHVVAKRVKKPDVSLAAQIGVHQAVDLAQCDEDVGIVEPVQVFDHDKVILRGLEEIYDLV